RLTGQPPRQAAHELLTTGHDAQVRPAERHWAAKRLPLRYGDIRSIVAWAPQQPQADRVERNDDLGPRLVRDAYELIDLFQATEEVRVLKQHAGGLIVHRGSELFRLDRSAWRLDGL